MSHIRVELPNTSNKWVEFGLTNVNTFIIFVGFRLTNVDTIRTLTRHEHNHGQEVPPLDKWAQCGKFLLINRPGAVIMLYWASNGPCYCILCRLGFG